MARTSTRKTQRAAKALPPMAKLRKFTATARKTIEGGFAATRSLVAGKAAEAREAAIARAEDARSRAVDAVTGLEKLFEQRVSSAIARLGVPTSRDVRALSRQVAQLQASVQQLKRARARA